MKCFMKKGTVANKIGIMVVTLSLSMAMLTGCGNRADRNSDEVSTEAAWPLSSTGLCRNGASGKCR